MVLESLINPLRAEKKPWEMFVIGAVYASVAAFLSLWIFSQYASLVMVFLTMLASVPIMYATFKYEEKKDKTVSKEYKLLKEHSKALTFMMLYFLGMTVAFTLWYVFAPQSMAESLFRVQTQTILDINNRITGDAAAQNADIFFMIFLNNLKVLIFCILFAFIYGVGAVFILTWNATVISTAIGNFIRSRLAESSNYFNITSLGILRYLLHGIPEILAYFIAGLAGSIISVAVINHDFKGKQFQKILIDSSDLLLISIGVLFVAAVIEVFVTPILI